MRISYIIFAAFLLEACSSADASPPDLAPIGAAVPVYVDQGPNGEVCYHSASPPAGFVAEWDGLAYNYIVTNPACCPPGYTVVGRYVGGIVCLVVD